VFGARVPFGARVTLKTGAAGSIGRHVTGVVVVVLTNRSAPRGTHVVVLVTVLISVVLQRVVLLTRAVVLVMLVLDTVPGVQGGPFTGMGMKITMTTSVIVEVGTLLV
jgi:hypothetical protein